MKYFLTIIVALALIVYAFFKGYSLGDHEDDRAIAFPCTAESILFSKNPDARYNHCHDQDWDGSTLLRDRWAEAEELPDVYAILLEGMDVRGRIFASPQEMTTDDDPDPQTTIQKPSPAHRGSL